MSAPRTFPGYAVGPALHKPGSPAQRPARMLNIAPDVDRVTVKVTDHGAEFAVTLDRDMAEDAGHALINAAAGERTDEALEPWEHASEPPSREWLDEVRQALQEPMAASRGHKRTLRACRRLYDALMAVSADQPGNAAAPAERKQPVMPEAVTAAAQWWAGRLHARYADRYDAFLAALDLVPFGALGTGFLAGANSIFYGDQLLTTANPQAERDRAAACLEADAAEQTAEEGRIATVKKAEAAAKARAATAPAPSPVPYAAPPQPRASSSQMFR